MGLEIITYYPGGGRNITEYNGKKKEKYPINLFALYVNGPIVKLI